MRQPYTEVDFPAVLEQFARLAYGAKTAQKIRNAEVLGSVLEMNEALALAKEAAAFWQQGSNISLGGIGDITRPVKAAQKGVTLLPSELLEITNFLAACHSAAHAFDPEIYPLLADLASTLTVLPQLARAIDEAIDFSGQVRPDANTTLKNLHEKLQDQRAQLNTLARRFVKSHNSSLADTTITTIGGRTCVLVKASDKYKFGGMVHGSSQSGNACYLEPQQLVDANNELNAIVLDIEEEKKRICRELSGQVKAHSQALLSNDETIEAIDLALAKGRWMADRDGCVPVLQSAHHGLRIHHAIHPLLDRKSAVANSYTLQPDQACLMITGSNTGGKTVILKTIGLFLLLAHCGFPIQAHDAVLPWYHQFFFVIGDQQSIEENLSTFSGHVRQLSRVVEQADERTFALLDEIGNGTDPAQGAALAQAVLESLIERKATIVTSTHYNEVKTYGKTSSRILVGSVEFDPATLRPTYRYLPGVSGASYAFDIARQYGLPQDLIERAAAIQQERESDVDRQMAALEKQQALVQKQKDRFDHLVNDAHRLQKEAKEDQAKWESMKKRFDAEYESKLESMLFEKKEEARAIIRDLKAVTHQASHVQIEQMGRLSELAAGKERTPQEKVPAFQAGDYVRIETLNNHGEIISVKKNRATVLVNGRKVQVDVDKLTPMAKPQAPKPVRRSSRPERSFKAFPLELNLIGMRVEEGLDTLEHYIDQAVYHRVKMVRIVHGMGTGALRSAVWKELNNHPAVKQLTSAAPNQGGFGATIVELK